MSESERAAAQLDDYLERDRVTGAGRPRTICSLTEEGRRAFQRYLALLEQIVKQGGALTWRNGRDSNPRPPA